jgi:hypothetical protein
MSGQDACPPTGWHPALSCRPSPLYAGTPPRAGWDAVNRVCGSHWLLTRACPLREQCQWHGTSSRNPRRKSRRATSTRAEPPKLGSRPSGAGCSWPHSLGRLATSLPSAAVGEPASPAACRCPSAGGVPLDSSSVTSTTFPCEAEPIGDFRGKTRLARNAAPSASPSISITLFGLPEAFAQAIGLSTRPSAHPNRCLALLLPR